jgi:putative cardiolipin synthase
MCHRDLIESLYGVTVIDILPVGSAIFSVCMHNPIFSSGFRAAVLVGLIACLCGCASVDFDYPKEVSTARSDTADTTLGQRVDQLTTGHAGEAGFYPLIDSVDSLATRLLLAGMAEQTIDVQYYLISSDIVGGIFVYSLLQAADRGVRVRLLIDDIQTKGQDPGMVALDSHPNVEVRVFNPFARRGLRSLDGLFNYSRVNRRMHNKSFIVDNQVAVVGGRNMAAEYFGAHDDEDFGDLDVMCVGAVTPEISTMFDAYWNHRAAVPVPGFTKIPDDLEAAEKAFRGRMQEFRRNFLKTPYAEALESKVLEYLKSKEAEFVWSPYLFVYDSPDKVEKKLANSVESIRAPLLDSIQSATEELLIISPYFVPRKRGVELLIAIQESGVNVIVVTNSLAANNQPIVHGGYMPVRKQLLEAGVRLFEVKPERVDGGDDAVAIGAKKATLHAKAFLVDRREIFIGSFNFDPRSAYINTESGVIIKSPELAGAIGQIFDERAPMNAYEVFLNEKGQLRWKHLDGGEWVTFSKEPNTTMWKRFTSRVLGWLPIKSQL